MITAICWILFSVGVLAVLVATLGTLSAWVLLGYKTESELFDGRIKKQEYFHGCFIMLAFGLMLVTVTIWHEMGH